MDFLGVILLIVLIFPGTLHGIFLNFYNRNYPGEEADATHVYSSFLGLIVAFVSFAIDGFSFNFSWLSMLMGIINGFAVLIFNRCLAKGTELGSYSITMISALAAGVLMPLLATVVFEGSPGYLKLIGIAIMLVAFVLICVDFKEETKAKAGFVGACIGVAISNGAYGVLNSLEERFESGIHSDEFILFTYLTLSVASFVILMARNRRFTLAPLKQTRKSMLFLILGSLCIAANINLIMLVFKFVSSEIAYTFINGGTLVVSALLSLIIYRERISLQKWIGIAAASASMVILAL